MAPSWCHRESGTAGSLGGRLRRSPTSIAEVVVRLGRMTGGLFDGADESPSQGLGCIGTMPPPRGIRGIPRRWSQTVMRAIHGRKDARTWRPGSEGKSNGQSRGSHITGLACRGRISSIDLWMACAAVWCRNIFVGKRGGGGKGPAFSRAIPCYMAVTRGATCLGCVRAAVLVWRVE